MNLNVLMPEEPSSIVRGNARPEGPQSTAQGERSEALRQILGSTPAASTSNFRNPSPESQSSSFNVVRKLIRSLICLLVNR